MGGSAKEDQVVGRRLIAWLWLKGVLGCGKSMTSQTNPKTPCLDSSPWCYFWSRDYPIDTTFASYSLLLHTPLHILRSGLSSSRSSFPTLIWWTTHYPEKLLARPLKQTITGRQGDYIRLVLISRARELALRKWWPKQWWRDQNIFLVSSSSLLSLLYYINRLSTRYTIGASGVGCLFKMNRGDEWILDQYRRGILWVLLGEKALSRL